MLLQILTVCDAHQAAWGVVIFAQFSQFLEEWKNMQPKAHYIVLPHIFVVRILNTESLGSMYRNHQLLRTVPLIPNCTIPSIPDISSWLSLEPLVTTIRVCRGAGSRRHEAVVVVWHQAPPTPGWQHNPEQILSNSITCMSSVNTNEYEYLLSEY